MSLPFICRDIFSILHEAILTWDACRLARRTVMCVNYNDASGPRDIGKFSNTDVFAGVQCASIMVWASLT
jgi:hypothetical protein